MKRNLNRDRRTISRFFVGLVGMLASGAEAAPANAPIIEHGAHTFIAFSGRPAKISIPFTPVAGATSYRASWLVSGTTIDVELPAGAALFERAEPVAGHHTLTLVAIVDGHDSPKAEIGVDVVPLDVVAPGFLPGETPRTTAFATGSAFSSPGLRCRLGASEPLSRVVARTVGRAMLRCGGESGQPTVELPLIIAPVRVASASPPVPRGEPTRVHVTLATVAAIGDHLDVRATGDLEVGAVARTELGLDVTVTPRADARTAGLEIGELGHVDLTLTDAPPEIAARDEPAWLAVDLGGHLGAFIPPFSQASSNNNNIGHPGQLRDTITSGPLAGGRIGFFPTRHVGLEAEVAVAGTGYASGSGASAVLIGRLGLAARVVEDGRYDLRLLAGADLLTELVDRGTSHRVGEGGVHAGAAFSIALSPRLALRLEALDVITPAQDAGFAHSFELQLGAVTRLGRRDRGE